MHALQSQFTEKVNHLYFFECGNLYCSSVIAPYIAAAQRLVELLTRQQLNVQLIFCQILQFLLFQLGAQRDSTGISFRSAIYQRLVISFYSDIYPRGVIQLRSEIDRLREICAKYFRLGDTSARNYLAPDTFNSKFLTVLDMSGDTKNLKCGLN